MHVLKKMAYVAGLAVLALSTVASASVPWTTPNGTNGVVTYSNGSSDNGYFGDPTILGTNFTFNPSGFVATASNGAAQTTSDRVTFDFFANNGGDITTVSFRVFGDWSILGSNAAVAESGALFLTVLSGTNTAATNTAGYIYSASEVVTYTPNSGPIITSNAAFPQPTNPSGTGAGLFDGVITINLAPGVKSVRLALNDQLQAIAGSAATAFIQKKGVGGPANGGPQIVINGNLPEPASMTVLLLGGVALMRRRRCVA